MIHINIKLSTELNDNIEKALELHKQRSQPFAKIQKYDFILYLLDTAVKAELEQLTNEKGSKNND